jgi:hypothetical protein
MRPHKNRKEERMTQPLFDFLAAERDRDAGMAATLDKEDNTPPGKWSDRVRDAIVAYGRQTRRAFTTEEVRRSGLIEEPSHYASWGAAMRGAMKSGLIRHVGYTHPANRKSHASIVMTWEVV